MRHRSAAAAGEAGQRVGRAGGVRGVAYADLLDERPRSVHQSDRHFGAADVHGQRQVIHLGQRTVEQGRSAGDAAVGSVLATVEPGAKPVTGLGDRSFEPVRGGSCL